VLILDEPTNHLDLEAIEALVVALKQYEGTLIFVSHDRWFVSELADHIVEITPQGLQRFEGTYEEYVAKCGDDHLDSDAVALKVKREKRKKKAQRGDGRGSDDAKALRKLAARRDELTSAIEKGESRVHEINEIFCDPQYFERTSTADVKKLEQEQKRMTKRVEELMQEWEGVEEDLAAVSPVP